MRVWTNFHSSAVKIERGRGRPPWWASWQKRHSGMTFNGFDRPAFDSDRGTAWWGSTPTNPQLRQTGSERILRSISGVRQS